MHADIIHENNLTHTK